MKHLSLELGGHAPFIVFVQRSVTKKFTKKLTEEMAAMKVDPLIEPAA